MPNVAWQRPELREMMEVYLTIRDVLAGSQAIKGRRSVGATAISGANGWENIGGRRRMTDARRYLPQPNPDDTSPENRVRYISYLERAPWFGATSRTLEGLRGLVFQQDPDLTVPEAMKVLLENIDGTGVTAVQQLARAVDYNMAYSRGGFLADFPPTTAELTAEDIAAGDKNAIVRLYAPWQIINWRIAVRGSHKYLSMLVLIDDDVHDDSDEFISEPITQFRVLRVNEQGQYTAQIWQERVTTSSSGSKSKELLPGVTIVPTDADGKPFDEIPFYIFGITANDFKIDKPAMQDIAETNVAHYRNAADYEDSTHQVGQATPYASGLTESWVKNIWKGKQIPLGSRAVIPLPVNGEMGLLQASENSMVRQAMLDKEAQMIMLGAKLIEPQKGQQAQTATGELIDESGETSTLGSGSKNVGQAFRKALVVAARFMRVTVSVETLIIKLNPAFQWLKLSPGDRQELVAEWQKGAKSWTEMRATLRAAGDKLLPDAEAKAEIEQERADAIATGMIATPVGVDLAPAAAVGQARAAAVDTPPPGQAPNPRPPAKKQPPTGKK